MAISDTLFKKAISSKASPIKKYNHFRTFDTLEEHKQPNVDLSLNKEKDPKGVQGGFGRK